MADVTVDERSMAKLPYDPDTIPPAVRKRAAAVDALYSNKPATPAPEPAARQGEAQVEQPSADPPEASASQLPQAQEAQPPEPSTPATPAPAAPSSPPTPEDENSESWKRRFLRMQGMHTSAQKTIGEMQEQMTQLGNELLQVQRHVAQPARQQAAPPPPPPPAYITERDVQNYGAELLDVTQRAAMQVVAPKLQEIELQNEDLRRQLAREQKRALDQALELAVPNWREINQHPRWHRWLLSLDPLTGRVRQQLLNEATAAASAPRVISFFRGFLQEEVATGHSEPAPISRQAAPPREAAVPLSSLAVPGRARPATGGDTAVPPNKPTYTRADIARLYDQQRRGAYAGREAEWARQEADIIAAPLEGRVRS